MRRLVVDMDSTLVNSIKSIVNVYNTLYKKDVNWRDVRSWDFSCVFEDVNKTKILWLFEHPLFFENLEFYPGALEILEELYLAGYQIDIYSAGTQLNKERKIHLIERINSDFQNKYIKANRPFLNWINCDSIMHGKSCQDLSDAIFIDDRIDNLTSSNAYSKILFKYENKDYDWNLNWNGKIAYQWDTTLRTLIDESFINKYGVEN